MMNDSNSDLLDRATRLPNITHVLIFGDLNYPNIQWENMIADVSVVQSVIWWSLNL